MNSEHTWLVSGHPGTDPGTDPGTALGRLWADVLLGVTASPLVVLGGGQ